MPHAKMFFRNGRILLAALLAALVIGLTTPAAIGQTSTDTSVPTAPVQESSSAAGSKARSLSLFQIIFSGGPLGIANMIILIGLSIAAVALTADDLRIVRRSQLIPPSLSDDVRALVAAGEHGQALSLCDGRPSFVSTVIRYGLSETSGGWREVEKAMEDATAEQSARLYRRIEYLSVIGNIAPMVGLLGTVTGMLLAFKQVADTEGNAGAAQLADGIYQALVTTVAGLIIAIPSLGAFALLRSRVDELVAEAAYAALHALSPLKQRPAASGGAIPPPPAQKRA